MESFFFKSKKKFILASGSPRRQKLLEAAGIDFEVIIPEEEKNILNRYFSYEAVEKTAAEKGKSVLKKIKYPATVISADTVVIYDNVILGKPKDFDDAFRMLKLLSGNTHKVVTAVCLTDSVSGKQTVKSDTSEVTFKKLTDEKIKDYIYTFKPYDKAGSYGIQELNDDFTLEIKGDFDNIVGLPVKMLTGMLQE